MVVQPSPQSSCKALASPKSFLIPHLWSVLAPSPSAPLVRVLSPGLPFLEVSQRWTHTVCHLVHLDLSLSVFLSFCMYFLCVFVCIRSMFRLTAECHSPVPVAHVLFIHSPRTLECFPFRVVMNNAAVIILTCVLFWFVWGGSWGQLLRCALPPGKVHRAQTDSLNVLSPPASRGPHMRVHTGLALPAASALLRRSMPGRWVPSPADLIAMLFAGLGLLWIFTSLIPFFSSVSKINAKGKINKC